MNGLINFRTGPAMLLIFAALCGNSVVAQEALRTEQEEGRERIETERHDFTQSTTTVGRGVFQIESGYSFFRKSERGETETSHTAPETLFRFGLTEDVEFRIRYNEVWQFASKEVSLKSTNDHPAFRYQGRNRAF